MTEEQIAKVNEWFERHKDSFTYHEETEYCVCLFKIDMFAQFLSVEFPDIIGIQTRFHPDGSILFDEENLKNVAFI